MKDLVLRVAKNKRLMKYFFMAVTIVAIELAIFQTLYLILNNYMAATALSFTIAVVLNWIGSRLLVFGASQRKPTNEFFLVLVASIIGIFIQISVVYVSVEALSLYPLIGKSLSILFSFFWNYAFRSKIIYR